MKKPQILFYDNHLFVVNKPGGMLTQPNHSTELSLEAFGKNWVKRRFEKDGRVFLEAVHRIDRPVSGIVLFARTSKALARLHQAQRNGDFHKHYLALVEGRLKKPQGTLKHYLKHGNRRAYVEDAKKLDAKCAVLKYRAVKEDSRYTLLHISLETGRYHQIRVQLSAIGYPIIGDLKYGSKKSFPTIALHHVYLQVPHPISGKPTSWQTLLPHNWPFAFDGVDRSELFQ